MINYNNNNEIRAEVERLLSENNPDEALKVLDKAVEVNNEAVLFYERGRLLWKLGRKTDAMSDYSKAVSIDPKSPAAVALQMACDVMDFYNHDLYNP